ncbi:hypothetical protein C8J56DRAFT_284096 [Mycena floridula]|nr:hypothetical protein C8J56DRAFT_284096 [Mycena floridula]
MRSNHCCWSDTSDDEINATYTLAHHRNFLLSNHPVLMPTRQGSTTSIFSRAVSSTSTFGIHWQSTLEPRYACRFCYHSLTWRTLPPVGNCLLWWYPVSFWTASPLVTATDTGLDIKDWDKMTAPCPNFIECELRPPVRLDLPKEPVGEFNHLRVLYCSASELAAFRSMPVLEELHLTGMHYFTAFSLIEQISSHLRVPSILDLVSTE